MRQPPQGHAIEALIKEHDRTAFCCGKTPLDDYLRRRASQDHERHVAFVFVLVAADSPQVIGYYTLSAMQILLTDLPSALQKKLPRYPMVPATLLGRLAVDTAFRGQHLGEFLLFDALHRALPATSGIASWAVVVDPIDDEAAGFSRYYDFEPLPGAEPRMFIPTATVIQALAKATQ